MKCIKCGWDDLGTGDAHVCGPVKVKEHIDYVREAFEKVVYPSFPGIANGLRRDEKGQYISDALEDHWQTFQEGWACATVHILGERYGVE